MRKDLLIAIDVCAVLAAASLLLVSWFYLPRETFMWGAILSILALALAACINIHYIMAAIIEVRRKASGKTSPRQKLPWLTILNFMTALVILAIMALFWFYMPREMIGWGVLLAQLVFLLIFLLNAGKLASDYIDSGKTAN